MIGHGNDPDDASLKEFRMHWLGRHAFSGARLVYSTGRNKSDALNVAIERGLLRPSLLICGVGTEVYRVPDTLPLSASGEWAQDPSVITLDEAWSKQMSQTFDRKTIEQLLVDQFPKFEVHGNEESDPYRIPTKYEVTGNLLDDVEAVRAAVGPTVEVIVSGGSEWKYVDFCSVQAGKQKAMEFAMSKLGFTPEQTLACGDSGNDESMYRSQGVRCVAVGNSLPELVTSLENYAKNGPDAVQKGTVFETSFGSRVLYADRP